MQPSLKHTIEKIKAEHIRPESRLKYLGKKYSLWLAFAAAVVLAAIALAVTYYLITQLDWDLYRFQQRNIIMFVFSSLPVLWIILLVLLMGLSFWNLRKTEAGYRYEGKKIVVILLLMVLVIGVVAVVMGSGASVHQTMMHRMHGYHQMVATKESQWSQPEQGLIAGTIISLENGTIGLRDLENKEWSIEVNDQTFIRPMARLDKDSMIKIVGEKKEDNVLVAIDIRPWQGQGRGMHRQGGQMPGPMMRNQMQQDQMRGPMNGQGRGMGPMRMNTN